MDNRAGSRGVEPQDKTTRRIRGTTAQIQLAARHLRRLMTPAEQVLWDALRDRRLGGLRFRSQHPAGPFVLDFYCPIRKLVVEVDGPVHERQAEYDAARTVQLNAYGYRVIRFRNEEVLHELPLVLERILAAASESDMSGPPRRRESDRTAKDK